MEPPISPGECLLYALDLEGVVALYKRASSQCYKACRTTCHEFCRFITGETNACTETFMVYRVSVIGISRCSECTARQQSTAAVVLVLLWTEFDAISP